LSFTIINVDVWFCIFGSREMPMQLKNQRKANLIASVEEVDQHIKKLVERYGSFAYPSPRTPYNPNKDDEQLQQLIPGYRDDFNQNHRKFIYFDFLRCR
jgi:hypothetical protein